MYNLHTTGKGFFKLNPSALVSILLKNFFDVVYACSAWNIYVLFFQSPSAPLTEKLTSN